MTSFHERLRLAKRELSRSVVDVNLNIDVQKVSKDTFFYGVKDTDQIPDHYLRNIGKNERYIRLTTDKASDYGRAIDPDLTNPITYRAMTGSTSGGPINILKGIIDFSIGTDGGGSVLAPAMSCQLPAIIGAGLGLYVKESKTSTDDISFIGSVGVIGKRFFQVKQVIECMQGKKFTTNNCDHMTVAIPKKGSVIRPDGKDMHDLVTHYIKDFSNVMPIEIDMTGIEERKQALEVIQKSFEQADYIITCEGPVDVFGYGESIPQAFGKAGRFITQNHGKYLIRGANMCHTTTITIPTKDLASGFVILAKYGFSHASKAIQFAQNIEEKIQLPSMWYRYFLNKD